MKLVRCGSAGREKPGLLDGSGAVRDLSGIVDDIGPDELAPERLAQLAAIDPSELPMHPDPSRFGPPVRGVRNFHAIGFNYTAHVGEVDVELPSEPIVFTKATSCISGPNDPIVLPRGSVASDWEVELGIVIGTPTWNVDERDALANVAGYCIVDDVSERDFQGKRGGQWVKGKSSPTFGPLGPWLVTTDEVPDPQDLDLWLEVNGVRHQSANTKQMIFGCAFLVSYLSQFLRLLPGDVIATGTPAGIGAMMEPPQYLQAGDTIRASVAGLGEQVSPVVPYDDRPAEA